MEFVLGGFDHHRLSDSSTHHHAFNESWLDSECIWVPYSKNEFEYDGIIFLFVIEFF